VLGLAMAAAGILTDQFGARVVWTAAGIVYLVAALVAVFMTRWLPVSADDEHDAFEASSESAVATLGNGLTPSPEPAEDNGNGTHEPPLERIANLLEEIEARRKAESRRTP
jgi:hypothetical protein